MDLLYSKLTLSSFRRARGPVYSANEGALSVSSPRKAPGKPPDAPEAPEITWKDRPTDAHGAPPPTHAYIDFSLKKSNSEAIILKACIDNNYIISICMLLHYLHTSLSLVLACISPWRRFALSECFLVGQCVGLIRCLSQSPNVACDIHDDSSSWQTLHNHNNATPHITFLVVGSFMHACMQCVCKYFPSIFTVHKLY